MNYNNENVHYYALNGKINGFIEKGLPLSNGDFLISGETEDSPNSSNMNIFLIRTDSLGNEKWRKIYNYGGYQYVKALYEDSLGYIFLGAGDGTQGGFIMKTDENGDLIWKRKTISGTLFGSEWAGPCSGLSVTQDNQYFMCVGGTQISTTNSGLPNYLGVLYKIDFEANIIWHTIFGPYPSPHNQLADAIATQDGGAVAGGSVVDTNSQFGTTQMGWLVKTDGNGNLLWQRYFGILEGAFSDHWILDILELPDGSLAGCGWVFPASPPDTGQQDAWIFKTDSYGCLIPGCNATDGIDDPQNANLQLLLYPNPAAEYIAILQQGKEGSRFTAEVYDMQGQKLKTFPNLLSNVTYTWDIGNMASGVYVIQTFDGKGKSGRVKFVKK